MAETDNTLRAGPSQVRLERARNGTGQTAIGWLAALLLHGGLLAAVILGQPMRLPSPPGQAAVSLLLLPPGQKQPAAAVMPKPAFLPAEQPKEPASVIANAPPPSISSKPSRPPAAPTPTAPRGGIVAHPTAAAIMDSATAVQHSANVAQLSAPAAQGFVSAEPLGGNVNQPPDYPQAAVNHGEQGNVLLSIHVLPDGRTDFVSVTRSSGYRVLDQAAQDAVLQWRFQPASVAGRKMVMVIPFWINFDLQTQSVQPGQ